MTRVRLRTSLSGWARLLGATFWTLRARRRLRRSDLDGAVLAYQEALRRRPGRCDLFLGLAEAHLRGRRLAEARRALHLAREADLRKYEQRAALVLARCGYDLEGVMRPAPPRPEPVTAPARARAGRVAAGQLPFGDCQDLDEYARFRAMPPITRDEIEGMDLDDMLGDLFDN